jgi:hypothetical protein
MTRSNFPDPEKYWSQLDIDNNNDLIIHEKIKIGLYKETAVLENISPNRPRNRGRPVKDKNKKEKTNPRQPSEYNMYIKENMLSDEFSHIKSGRERLTIISKLYKNSKNNK